MTDGGGEQPVALFMVGQGGGGHKASALAVQDCLLSELGTMAVRVEFIDVGELSQRTVGGPNGDEWYNWLMQNNMFCCAGRLGHVASMGAPLVRGRLKQAFGLLWERWRPVVVVSFVPFVNSAMREALHEVAPKSYLITVVTDMASTSAHSWIDPQPTRENGEGQEVGEGVGDEQLAVAAHRHIIVAGTPELVATALDLGYQEATLKTSGMVVHPAFYKAARRAAERQGLEKERAGEAGARTALVYFGAYPPARADSVAMGLLRTLPGWRVVVLCGHNAALLNRLQEQRETAGADSSSSERIPECRGFLGPEELAAQLADASLVAGKPGPGAVAEAAVCGVPFLTERQYIMPQEEAVLTFLEFHRSGIVVENLVEPPQDLLDRLQACNSGLVGPSGEPLRRQNQAVFQVSRLLQVILTVPQDVTAHLKESQRESAE